MPPFLTPMMIAPGCRCWVALLEEEEGGEEEEGDEEEMEAGELETPERNSLKHTDR